MTYQVICKKYCFFQLILHIHGEMLSIDNCEDVYNCQKPYFIIHIETKNIIIIYAFLVLYRNKYIPLGYWSSKKAPLVASSYCWTSNDITILHWLCLIVGRSGKVLHVMQRLIITESEKCFCCQICQLYGRIYNPYRCWIFVRLLSRIFKYWGCQILYLFGHSINGINGKFKLLYLQKLHLLFKYKTWLFTVLIFTIFHQI